MLESNNKGKMEATLMKFNTVGLVSVLVHELQTNLEKNVDIQKASTAILAIAGTQYTISAYLYGRYPKLAEEIRYIDWILTTPLLLYTYWRLANVHGYESKFKYLAVAVILMIALGFMAENGDSRNWFIISMIPYFYILYEILNIQKMFKEKKMEKHYSLGQFFIYGWAIYPAAFYAPDTFKYVLYSIGDFVNKGVYSIMLYNILKNE